MSLKDEIIANPFVDKLRLESKVDQESFDALCDRLRALATEWSNQTLIDKELMLYLYFWPWAIQSVATSLRDSRPDLANKIGEMGIIIDGLILAALE